MHYHGVDNDPKQHLGYAMGMMQGAFLLGAALGPLAGGPFIEAYECQCNFPRVWCDGRRSRFRCPTLGERGVYQEPAGEGRRISLRWQQDGLWLIRNACSSSSPFLLRL